MILTNYVTHFLYITYITHILYILITYLMYIAHVQSSKLIKKYISKKLFRILIKMINKYYQKHKK